jgi:peptide/nickel transport system substrate-binding protein
MARPKRNVWCALLALSVVAAACGDDGGGGDATATTAAGTGGSGAATTTAVPVSGGVLTVGTYQDTMGLDPIVSTGGGITGGNEMAAIYDTITFWDPVKNVYVPRTAESVTPNADFTEWTIKLRSGIKFTDGTDYDADAVTFQLNRSMSGLVPGVPACEELRACPRNVTATGSYMAANVKSVQTVDKLTVKVTASQAFPTFPAMLAGSPGMVVSPTAIKAACPADKTATPGKCSFNTKPVGAGPFTLDTFAVGEAITLKKNPNYWNGPVYLDGLKFVNLGDAGGDKNSDGLKTGALQVAYLRQWTAVRAAADAKFPGFSSRQSGGVLLLMNNGLAVTCANGAPAVCASKPDGPYTPPVATSRLKVRQGIAAAIDPVQFDARVYDGKGEPNTNLVDKTNPYYPGVDGPKYDLAKAKQLFTEAKADGWDGKLRLACSTTPYGEKFSQVVQLMLAAAGVNVEIKLVPNPSTEVILNRDYDTACWGFSPYADDLGFWQLYGNLNSTSSANRMGYKSTAMDAGLAAVRSATTNDQKKSGFKQMAEAYLADQPSLAIEVLEERAAWNPKVQGLQPSVQTSLLFDKAWITP